MTRVFADSNNYMLSSPGLAAPDPENAASRGTGLIDASDRTLVVTTGTDTGPVFVTALVLARAPEAGNERWAHDGWSEVAEASLFTDDGDIASFSVAVTEDGPLVIHAGPPGYLPTSSTRPRSRHRQ